MCYSAQLREKLLIIKSTQIALWQVGILTVVIHLFTNIAYQSLLHRLWLLLLLAFPETKCCFIVSSKNYKSTKKYSNKKLKTRFSSEPRDHCPGILAFVISGHLGFYHPGILICALSTTEGYMLLFQPNRNRTDKAWN